jgi:hypothetical protein
MKFGIVFLVLALGLIGTAIYMAAETRANIELAAPGAENRPVSRERAEKAASASVGEATTDEEIARQLRNLELELQGSGTAAADFSIERAIANQQFTLTPLQKQVRDTPAIARIETVVREEGFVVLDAGLDQNLQTGMNLAVRRQHYIVAKLIVGETIDTSESIASIAPNSIPNGIELRPGDPVIPWDDIVALKKKK